MKPTRLVLRLATLLLLFGSSAHAQDVSLPDTPAGRGATAWFRAYNGTEQDMRHLYETGYAPGPRPVEERLARWRDMRSQAGPLTPIRAAESAERSITVFARDGHGGFANVTVDVTPADPALIVGVRIEPAEPGEAGPTDTSPLTEPQVVDSITTRVGALAQAGAFSGVVRLEHGGKLALERAWGEANREKHVANRIDTKFNLGSINKTFTKTVIAKLVEQGKVSPDDKLSKYLPDFPRDKGDRITIQQLLDMRSGLGDFFGPKYDAADKSKLRNPRDWFPLFIADTLLFAPGTSESYSNAGYDVLGAVAEAVTGKSYYDLVRAWIYQPAGMRRSDSYSQDDRDPNLAVGYTRRLDRGPGRDSGPWVPNTPAQPWRGSPAGGGYSTAQDLSRFVHALEAGKILAPETVERFYGARRNPEGTVALGLGIAGGSPGVNAALEANGGWTLVVLSNLDPPSAEALARQVRGWLKRVKE